MSPTTHAAREPGRHLVLVGPTAAGKSAVAQRIAERHLDGASEGGRGSDRPVEIVAVDSMQVYRGMDIGTATPTSAERRNVPHHLIDVVEPHQEFSLAEFVGAAQQALDEIEARGGRALLVGGTGLYVQAIVDGLQVPGRYPEVLAELESEPDTAALHRRLVHLDPSAAQRMEPSNRRRVLRALEVTLGSGRPFSEHGPGLDAHPDTPFVLVGLQVPRDELAARIERRYAAQLDAGFLDEVRALLEADQPWSRTAAQALGYRELAEHLAGAATLDQAVERAVIRTRQFAVRQIRWFRRDPRITWFDHVGEHGGDVAATAAAIDAEWSKRVAERRGSTATVAHSAAEADHGAR